MKKINFMKWGKAGAVFGILAYLIGWILSKIFEDGIATITFSFIDVDAGQQLRAGIDQSLGAKIMAAVQGIPIISQGFLQQALIVVLSGIGVFIVGRLIAVNTPFPMGKTPTTRLMLAAVYGSVILGLLLGVSLRTLSIPVWAGSVAAMIIAFGIVAAIYALLNNKVSKSVFAIPE